MRVNQIPDSVPAQKPVADGMKRAAPKRAQFAADQLGDAPHHLARGFVRERQQQNPVGRDALFEQIGDAIRERARLARARAGDDERRAGRRGDGGELLLVEFARVIDLELNFSPERLQNVIARHAAKLRHRAEVKSEKRWPDLPPVSNRRCLTSG